ncbi:B12-binding domain-containing radical SAM protein [Candidatus Sumerlaeota bacterium]|nr:B12-binding domain-containing radical SAM protein [Candidatus Sumerlaeota bacterium]
MDDALPRMGLGMLAAALEAAGHDVRLLDLRFLEGWEDYERQLAAFDPEFVCVTANTVEIETAYEAFRRGRSAAPDAPTVGGGIHMTMFPYEAIETGCVDYVVRGEGEISLPRLVEDPGAFPPVFWGETPDPDALPFEDRDLYPGGSDATDLPLWDLPTPIVGMLTRRGCPWQCRFCCGPGEQNLFTRSSPRAEGVRVPHFRARSVENVIAELEAIEKRRPFRSIVFHDDQFLVNRRWVETFCDAFREAGFVEKGIRWWAACRADMICRYPETLRAMRDAGLQVVSIGFESFSDPLLEWMRKGTTREQNLRAAEICRDLGLDLFANAILGMPRGDGGWRIEDDLATLEAMREIEPKHFSPAFFSPIPGSWFYEWAMKNDWMPDDVAPQRAGQRTPSEAKIRGVDYERLRGLLDAYAHERRAASRAPRPSLGSKALGFLRSRLGRS